MSRESNGNPTLEDVHTSCACDLPSDQAEPSVNLMCNLLGVEGLQDYN